MWWGRAQGRPDGAANHGHLQGLLFTAGSVHKLLHQPKATVCIYGQQDPPGVPV
jgi:hypothetical protein